MTRFSEWCSIPDPPDTTHLFVSSSVKMVSQPLDSEATSSSSSSEERYAFNTLYNIGRVSYVSVKKVQAERSQAKKQVGGEARTAKAKKNKTPLRPAPGVYYSVSKLVVWPYNDVYQKGKVFINLSL